MLSKAEFFKEATCQLLHTLNLRTGLERLQAYIGSVLPCGEIRLSCFPSFTVAPTTNLHIRAASGNSSVYYGAPLSRELLDTLLALVPDRGEIISSASHPLVRFCQSLNASGHGLMPLPWYDLVLWEEKDLIGECRFSGFPDRQFTGRDCEYFDSLRPVLCIALSNYRNYLELQTAHNSIKEENANLKQALAQSRAREIVGMEGGLRNVVERVRHVARHDVPVLITGETGTGKELIARMVHTLSPRRDRSFVALNCGVIPQSLIDSELFGHVRGAFTGATRNYKGYFERAHGGTFFLDEVGELPPDAQVRLLRVLQEGEIQPLGSTSTIPVDVRIVAATNRDLLEMTRQGRFRQDLYYRLRCVQIMMPPLRERRQDIPDLVRHILREAADKSGIPVPGLENGEMARLQRHSWPGNIRELQNVVTEALLITPPGMPLRFHLEGEGEAPEEQQPSIHLTSDECLARHYARVLAACNGRIKGPEGAAAMLGVKPATLRFRLKKLGLLPG